MDLQVSLCSYKSTETEMALLTTKVDELISDWEESGVNTVVNLVKKTNRTALDMDSTTVRIASSDESGIASDNNDPTDHADNKEDSQIIFDPTTVGDKKSKITSADNVEDKLSAYKSSTTAASETSSITTDTNKEVQNISSLNKSGVFDVQSSLGVDSDEDDNSNNLTDVNENPQNSFPEEKDAIEKTDLDFSFKEIEEEDPFFSEIENRSQSQPSKSASRETLKQKKQMKEELRSIHSESQRMTRESDVKLPYHKPKVSSLSEFLNRRSFGKENKLVPLTPKLVNDVVIPSQVETPPSQTKSSDFKTPILSDLKRKLLKETQVANLTPTLSGKADFDVAETPKGLNNFMSRFIKQNQKRVETQPQEVKLHLVSKDTDENGKEDLTCKEITVKLNHDASPTPVNTAKFNVFKEQLLSEITKKKQEKQEKRLVAYDLDNEEGFEDEEEMSDELSDEENSDLEDFLGEDKCNSDKDPSDSLKHGLEDSEIQESLKLVLEDSEVQDSENLISTPKSSKIVRMDSGTLFLEDSEIENRPSQQIQSDSEKLFLEDSQVKPGAKKTDDELDSSFELMGSIIPCHQPGGGLKYGGYRESDDECTSTTTTPVKCHSLFGKKLYEEHTDLISPCNSPISPKFVRMSVLREVGIGDTQNENELLALCSGNFSSTRNPFQVSPNSCPTGNLASLSNDISVHRKDDFGNTQNYNELVELCSGKFSSSVQSNSFDKNNSLKELANSPFSDMTVCETKEVANSDEDDDIIYSSRKKIATKKFTKLTFVSDAESDVDENEIDNKDSPAPRNIISIENEESNDSDGFHSENNEFGENENDPDSAKRKLMKATDFFEEEAELSGSDVGSEDEYEGDDDDEENIFDDVVPSDEEMSTEELRNQIGKVHLKKLLDDDKKELRFFQEVYLEDGDLHTEGNGRERKFRWRNVDEDDVQEAKEVGSGDENEQNCAEDEKWRIQRFEREKWLKEQEALNTNEQWTGFKLNKRMTSNPTLKQSNGGAQNTSPFMVDQPKSFLSRNTDFCSQLAEKFQKQESNHVGRRSTKNFVFVSKSPSKQTKRSAEPVIIKEAKIRRLDMAFKPPVLSSRKSVFNFID